MTDAVDPTEARRFFDLDSIALIGASNDPKHFSHTVYVALKDHAVPVVPVNPSETSIGQDVCYPDVAAVPGALDGAIVMVNHTRAVQIVQECIDRGVHHIWLFKGLGGESALSDEAVALCHEHGVAVIAGACPMMFLRPVRGFHRFHRGIRRIRGDVAKAS
jgi:predicted CoA-binding protein